MRAPLTTDEDIKQLLDFDETTNKVSLTTDDLGFKWLVVTDPDFEALVTRIHAADTSMVEHGFGPRLLCAVFGFVAKTPPGEGAVCLVYLMKQGTFYPFAPTGPTQRNNELELRVRSLPRHGLAHREGPRALDGVLEPPGPLSDPRREHARCTVRSGSVSARRRSEVLMAQPWSPLASSAEDAVNDEELTALALAADPGGAD